MITLASHLLLLLLLLLQLGRRITQAVVIKVSLLDKMPVLPNIDPISDTSLMESTEVLYLRNQVQHL